jgi:DNA helicase-2/ATP-dependent DNA helicase PcrA
MTIGEVVPLAYDYVYNNPTCDERGAFDHVIVDEYQDLNRVEQALLELLSEDASLCVVGDDDQSIYSMRYANPVGITDFVARDDVDNYEISVCGRCPEKILAIANSLMRQAPGRDKPDLTCRTPDVPGTVAIVQWSTAEEEVSGIVASIAADVSGRGRPPGDTLVLTNWREVGMRIRDALRELDIPAQSFFREEELSTTAARDALATLRIAVDPADTVAMRVMLGSGQDTGRSETYRRLLVAAGEHGVSPAELLDRLLGGEQIQGLAVRALTDRYRDALTRAESLRSLEVTEAIEHLLPDGVAELADLRTTALAVSLDSPDLRALLDNVIRAITQDDVPQEPDFVRVMSLHKSKGLTSPVVYIASAVQGILPTLPGDQSQQQAAVEEGRRTFYVAITRASEKLVISSVSRMTMAQAMGRGVHVNRSHIRTIKGAPVAPTIASQYMSELGPDAPRPIAGTTWLAADTL